MINERYRMTEENLMRTFPEVLKNDEGMNPLGRLISKALVTLLGKVEHAKIYARIDQLDEPVLDILAEDLDVAWYDYNYSLETKRALIKDSFFVHRHLGTKGAIDRALSDIFPNSTVQEWFDYGGQPFYFRVVVDVTRTREEAQIGLIKKAVEYYKSYRSHLEENEIIVRITCGISIGTQQDGIGYSVPKSGTVPAVSTRGGIEENNLTVSTQSLETLYSVPKSGTIKAGTAPVVSTQGGVEESGVMAVATAQGGLYSPPKCGTKKNSLSR